MFKIWYVKVLIVWFKKKNCVNFYVIKDVFVECIDKLICYFNVGMGDNWCIVWEYF